ncbi:hypothetical protein HZA38_05335 [Candidatus Peregrinibacteria bacterium]|nr:hypothetical protein [Candidatus Peregrinibacteria bacterium]
MKSLEFKNSISPPVEEPSSIPEVAKLAIADDLIASQWADAFVSMEGSPFPNNTGFWRYELVQWALRYQLCNDTDGFITLTPYGKAVKTALMDRGHRPSWWG